MNATLFELPAAIPNHPCEYSWELLPVIYKMTTPYPKILDVFAGTGRRLLMIRPDAYLNELEPEWAQVSQAQTDRSFVGNVLALRWADDEFDAVVTSPTYGNRMADHHEAKDKSYRRTYRHCLRRPASPDSSTELYWGEKYWDFYRRAWLEVRRVLRPGGGLILNIKDFFILDQRQYVTDWHISCLQDLGFRVVEHVKVKTRGMRRGANGSRRMEYESVIHLELTK